ncbi:hypothetical protein HYV50_03820 [Candidatus Pacearchaeota archaeon]|nr:hypothetical protein [Candidatus Pacearchaeota archaeon]
MVLSGVGTIAFIFALLGVMKIIIVLFNKNFWIEKVAKEIYKGGAIKAVILAILAIIVFYFW